MLSYSEILKLYLYQVSIKFRRKPKDLKLEKFGATLISRELGSEAFKALQPQLSRLPIEENLEIDFSGILTLSPSWADEFLSPLLVKLDDRLLLLPSDNLSVHATLKILEEVNKRTFSKK